MSDYSFTFLDVQKQSTTTTATGEGKTKGSFYLIILLQGQNKCRRCQIITPSLMYFDFTEFYAGPKGGLCNQESHVIRTQEECATALEKLGYMSLNAFWIGSTDSIPAGCSIHVEGRNPHFETSQTGLGNGRSDLTPICRSSMKTEEEGKTIYT